jgi:VanZ family protein
MHERERGRVPGWLWAVWGLFLAAWTAALLRPEPARLHTALLPPGTQFPTAKALHVGSYALLTALACWPPAGPGRRWLAAAALSVHAFATEFLQQFVELRNGSLLDVGIDHVGLAAGLLAAWCAGAGKWREPGRADAGPETRS